MITLTGLLTLQPPEDRSLAYVDVYHNDNVYNWQIYIPSSVTNLEEFILNSEQKIKDDIDTKEAIWNAMDPKTKTIQDPFGETQIIDIDKNEIVCPTIPDYYALRRAEYPSIGDQLDALWKGINSQAYSSISQKIQEVKNKYPKN